MNKIVKSTALLMIFSSFIILSSCEEPIQPIKEEDKVVESVVYDLNFYDLDFLNNQTIDFTKGKIKATYTDGSIGYVDITSNMFDATKVVSDVGKHDLMFSISFVNGYSCQISVEYMIHSDQTILDFCKYSRFVPYENELKQSDIENVILACEYKNKLPPVLVSDYYYPYYSKVSNSEKAIVNVFKNAKEEELLTLYEGLYPNLYEGTDYLSCRSAVLTFVNRSFANPKEIKDSYENTIKVLQNVTKKDFPLDEYKLRVIDGLRNRFIVTLTELIAEGEKGSQTFFFKEKERNFYKDISFSLETYFEKIVDAKTKQEVDNINNEAFLGCFNEFKEVLADEITNTFTLMSNTFSKIDYNLIKDWKSWCAEKPDERDEFLVIALANMWDGKKFVIAPIMGGETGVSVEYLPPDDGRQCNIEPYRMFTIIDKTLETINLGKSVAQTQFLYNQLLFEFVQSACQKTLEMHYYYKQAMDMSFDSPYPDASSMAKYWKYVANYCGDTVKQKITYTGVMKEFYGRQYGYDYSSAYRLCLDFYGPSHPNTIDQLLEKLMGLLATLS